MSQRLISLGLFALLLSGCMALVGDGEPVGVKNGKPLYQARCTVDLSTAGQKGLFGSGPYPVHGMCSLAAEKRCGKGNGIIESVEESNFRMERAIIDTGRMRSIRTFPAVDRVVRFSCKA